MNRIVATILAVSLTAIAVLVFVYPRIMVGPGELIASHRQLSANCFACHAPMQGASAARCAVCHAPAAIGRLTTTGQPIVKAHSSTPFHQQLIAQDCMACHTDHAGVRRLKTAARFDHSLLRADARERCEGCHRLPADALHRQISGNCSQCHTSNRWTPATFDHDRYFRLDRDHNARCTTCHVDSDYRRYTCYGCHEHTPENIRSEHSEEGIRNFDNCVECHRSADEHDIRRGSGDDESAGLLKAIDKQLPAL